MNQVIICGAGPAGSSLAYFLARKNISVLLLDKEKFPRYKPCAGGYFIGLDNYFKFSLNRIVENACSSMTFIKGKKRYKHCFNQEWVKMVNRKDFDHYLLKNAIREGADFIPGVRVKKINKNSVITESGIYKGKIIVGAEGGASVVRKYGNYKGFERWMKTISADIPSQKYKDIIFDFSFTEDGYAWIFPKKNTVSAGLGDYPKNLSNMSTKFNNFLNRYNLSQPEKIYKFTYPVFHSMENLCWKNTLLVGDAASLSNPATGAGIFNAVQSSFLASRAIIANLKRGKRLNHYNRLVKRYIYPLLLTSRGLIALFENIPQPITALKISKPFLELSGKYLAMQNKFF